MKQDKQQSSPVTKISRLCHVLILCLQEIQFNNKRILTATTYFRFLNTDCIISVLNLWLSHVQDATETRATVTTGLFWNCLGGVYAVTCVWMCEPRQFAPTEQWPVHHVFIIDAFYKKQWQLHYHSTVTALAFPNKVQNPVPSANSIKTWINSAGPDKASKERAIHTLKNMESGIETESTKLFLASYSYEQISQWSLTATMKRSR